MSAELIAEALAGRFDRWRWSPGLSPEVIGATLDRPIVEAPVRHAGHDRSQAVVEVAAQPFPVRLRWDPDGELALVEFREPRPDLSWAAVLHSLGPPETTFEHGRGPIPGGDQLCYLSRGLTVFDSGGLGYQALWLYPPLTPEQYPGHTGAFESVQRMR
jgi:hypothetical protein